MAEIRSCPRCGVPDYITSEHLWLNNGVIVQKRDERARLAFIDCENLDPLFSNLEDIIGMPIERIIINASRRGTSIYYNRIMPQDAKEMLNIGELDPIPVMNTAFEMIRTTGYGSGEIIELNDEWRSSDFVLTMSFIEPCSVPIVCGVVGAGVQVILGLESSITYRELSPRLYELAVYKGENPPELSERLRWSEYRHSDGNTELERCPGCGGPLALSDFKWDMDRGVIESQSTGRHMALLSPQMIDAIFDDLEYELGEAVPKAIVEAQKRFVMTGFYSVDEVSDVASFREMLAIRGLGELRDMDISRKKLHVKLDRAALHPLVVGLVQGYYELATGIESAAEWEISDEGDLEVNITPV